MTSSIVALAGGVGAARLLAGLVQVTDPATVTVIGNVGDDAELFGLHVSPDLDIVTYTLAGLVDERGWGLAGDTNAVVSALTRFGYPDWFHLGDRDLATCLHRTNLLRSGQTLAEATDAIRRAFGLSLRILPVTNDRLRTVV
ncbi:MAG TPA: 2-phospho-L-lactate transferase CofD family protein, partial [Dehalococcoidia bacterium]|nr:2-phospho-L-lactate transferase CofD family protein [Dehalococcoidia bacterium]